MRAVTKLKYTDTHFGYLNNEYKLCNTCFNWFPCTIEYFYQNKSNSWDGLHPYCKECAIKRALLFQDNEVQRVRMKEHRRKNIKYRLNDRASSKRRNLDGRQKAWINANKDKVKQYNKNKQQNKIHKISKSEWYACKSYFNNECAYCGLPLENHWIIFKGELKLGDFHKEHVDHNGANDLSNCVPSCKRCNGQKWVFPMEEWYRQQDFFSQERLDKIYKWLNNDYLLFVKSKKNL